MSPSCVRPAQVVIIHAWPDEDYTYIVVGAFGMIPERLPGYLKELGIPDVVGGLQKTALLGTQRILKNVLSL